MNRRRIAACLTLVVAACRRESTPSGPNVVTVTATDFAFAAPDTIPAGLTTFRLVNGGQEPHHMVVIRLTQDVSQATLDSALMMASGPIPSWMSFPAGPSTTISGDTTNATSVLEPGRYVLACFIPSPDGQPHVMKGMRHNLVVVAPEQAIAAAPEPTADLVITMRDYSFELSRPLTAGTRTIRVVNAGPQIHEVGIELLGPDRTMADYTSWMQSGMQGPPPSRPMGGVIGPDVGKHATFTITLQPGRYLLTCYVPGPDGRPHVALGMVQEITVS